MVQEKNETQPIVRVEGSNGIAYYPRFHKNEKGEWELNDKSFQKMFRRLSTSEKPADTDKE